MGALWAEDAKFQAWIQVETAVCQAWARRKVIPPSAMKIIRKRAKVNVSRIHTIERRVQHDVLAFLTAWAEKVGPSSRYVHRGMTSSDLTDTAQGLQIQQAGKIIYSGMESVDKALRRLAQRAQGMVAVGRTHGIHAEPLPFSLRIAIWYAELGRGRRRFEMALSEAAVGKISGAVGNYAHMEPAMEAEVLKKLGLGREDGSNQIVQRDRHAALLTAMALYGTTIEKMAVELRHLQRTEVQETEEPFGKGQKGSSAMPHKKNPVILERVSGFARLLRGYSQIAMENMVLWHERDISHSSAERVILPDAFCTLDTMLERMDFVIRGLRLRPEKMKENLDRTRGLVFSQNVLLKLSVLMAREKAYAIVQAHALESWDSGTPLLKLLEGDARVTQLLSAKELKSCFDPRPFMRHEKTILRRVGLLGKGVSKKRG